MILAQCHPPPSEQPAPVRAHAVPATQCEEACTVITASGNSPATNARCPDRAVTQYGGRHLCWAHGKRAGWPGPSQPNVIGRDWEELCAARWDYIGACVARVT